MARSVGLSAAIVAGMVVAVAIFGLVALVSVFVIVVPPPVAGPLYGAASGWVDSGIRRDAVGAQVGGAVGGVALAVLPWLGLGLGGAALGADPRAAVGVGAYFVTLAAVWLVGVLVLAAPTAWMVGAVRSR